jgi:hypothetical protein
MKISATTRKSVFFVLLAGIFVWLFCAIFHPVEPRYQGRRLTEWAKEVCPLPPYYPKDWRSPELRAQNDRAVAAIQHIGAKAALPWALKLCRAKDSWLKRKPEEWIEDWVAQHNDQVEEYNETHSRDQWRSEIHVAFTTAADKQNGGGNIIWALGPKAAPVIPALIQLLQSQDGALAWSATYALLGIGTNAIPPVTALLASADKDIRTTAATTLGQFGPQARMAVPALVQCLENPDPATRFCAAGSLGQIKADAPLVVPAIVRCIESDTNNMSRLACFRALWHFGTNAKPAAPVLVHILESDPQFPSPNSPGGYSQASVVGALEKIDPEVAKPFFEKWKASLTNASSINASGLGHPPNPRSFQTNSASP